MRYNNRREVEQIGAAGSYFETDEYGHKARVLSTFWLYCDPNDLGFTPHQTTRGEGYWESWITLWMSQNVKPGSRVIDIGANHGYYTLFLLAHGCKVRAVEPQAYLADLIERSVKENGFKLETRTVDRIAISDETGVATLTTPNGHGMNATIAYDHGGTSVATEVETAKLDDFCEGKQYYDFIKVDVEGAESKLLAGSRKFIEENPKCVFLLEWRYDRMDPAAADATAVYIFDTFDVTWVDFTGMELPVYGPEHLATRQNEDWMLVLRKKK